MHEIQDIINEKHDFVPFTHGAETQSSMFSSHLTPVKPVGHIQVKLLILSIQVPETYRGKYEYLKQPVRGMIV